MRGKAGDHKPLDQEEDFNQPTTVPGSPAAEQQALPGTEVPPPAEPKAIQGGKMLAQFVRPHFEKEPDGDRFVGFELAFPLTKEHEKDGHLPTEVLEEWRHMRKGNVKRTEVESVEPQTIAIGLVPDDPEHDLILTLASIERPILSIIEETGSGKAQKVIRLSFRAIVGLQAPFAEFAVQHFGDSVWISMQRTQGKLL